MKWQRYRCKLETFRVTLVPLYAFKIFFLRNTREEAREEWIFTTKYKVFTAHKNHKQKYHTPHASQRRTFFGQPTLQKIHGVVYSLSAKIAAHYISQEIQFVQLFWGEAQRSAVIMYNFQSSLSQRWMGTAS